MDDHLLLNESLNATRADIAPRRFLAALLLTAFVASSGITVIYTMLATLYREFPGSPLVGWTVTVYWLGSAVFAALCGRVGDLVGYRRVMLGVLALAALGAGLSALAPSIGILVAGCALQSVAASATPLAMGLMRENLPPGRITSAVGILSAAGMVSAGIIYVIAGVVIDHYSWQGGFWFKIALCAVTLVAVLAWVPPSRRTPGRRIDFVRGLAFAPALCSVLLGIQQLRSWGVVNPRVWGLLGGGVAVLVLWARNQWRSPAPLIDMRILATRQMVLANGCMMCLAIGGMQIGQVFSLFYQQPAWTAAGFGLSATQTGVLMLTGNLVALVASPWSGRVAQRDGARRAALIGLVVLMLGWDGLILLYGRIALFVPAAMVCAFGLAFAHTAVYNLVLDATPVARTGEATGLLYVFFACFFAVGAQVIFTILGNASVSNGAATFPAPHGYVMAFVYVSLSAAVGIGVAFALPKRRAAQSRLAR